MKKIIFLLVGIVFISCQQTDRRIVHMSNSEFSENIGTMSDTQDQTYSQRIDTSIFDEFSKEKQQGFITNNKFYIDSVTLRYFDHYRSIENIDTIFEVLTKCSARDKILAPYYYYVLRELSKNNNIDGYIGEAICEKEYKFFIEQPEYFYKYMSYLTEKKDTASFQEILYNLHFIVSNLIDDHQLDYPHINQIFENHRKYANDSLINNIKIFLLTDDH